MKATNWGKIDFFYGLPLWLVIILVLATSLAVGLGSSFGLRKALGLRSTDEDRAHAVSLMQVVAAYIGILIAFAGVEVWQDFSDAENAVQRESASASQIYRGLVTLGPETVSARVGLRRYVNSVVNDEWSLLSRSSEPAH